MSALTNQATEPDRCPWCGFVLDENGIRDGKIVKHMIKGLPCRGSGHRVVDITRSKKPTTKRTEFPRDVLREVAQFMARHADLLTLIEVNEEELAETEKKLEVLREVLGDLRERKLLAEAELRALCAEE